MPGKLYFSVSFILLILLPQLVSAQEKYSLQLIGNDTEKSAVSVNYRKSFSDTLLRRQELDRFFSAVQAKGYLFVKIDSVQTKGNEMQVYYSLSDAYRWMHLDAGSVAPEFLSGIRFRERRYSEKPINLDDLNTILDDLLRQAENNGYPFAVAGLEDVRLDSNRVKASLYLRLNRYYSIDSVRLIGPKVITEKYLSSYLGIKEGSPYNEAAVQAISTRMEELPFLKEREPAKVIFKETHAELELYPEKRNANHFDGLLGIEPQTNQDKTQLIGQAKLSLHNAFKQAELLGIDLKLQPNSTRDIQINFLYPFLFSTPFGVDLDMHIRKQDTSFSIFSTQVGVFYLWKGMNSLKLFYQTNSSNLISVSDIQIANTLSDYIDMRTREYGLGLNYEALDYRLNPTKGYILNAKVSAGTRQIRKNVNLNEQLYDSIQSNTSQYRMQIKADRYLQIIKRHVLDLGIVSGALWADELFVNELFRIGGVNDLRGFDEQSIPVSSYFMYKIEYRYLLERNAYFSFFFNQAFYEMKRKGVRVNDSPYGIGTGINFETGLGIFSLSYALGKELTNPMSFQNGKIHFGIINYF